MTEFIIITASTYEQCLHACNKLRLPPPNTSMDGEPRVMYVGPKDLQRIRASIPDRVVHVRPDLNSKPEMDEVRDVTNARLRKPNVMPETVWL